MNEAVIIDCMRTAVGKAPRGTLKNTRPDDMAAAVFEKLLERHPRVSKSEIDDVILGCANPEAESGMNMARVAALRAVLPPDAPALIHGERVIRWGEATARSNRLARALIALGATPGDKVAIYMHNRPEYTEALAACFKARARMGSRSHPSGAPFEKAEIVKSSCSITGRTGQRSGTTSRSRPSAILKGTS